MKRASPRMELSLSSEMPDRPDVTASTELALEMAEYILVQKLFSSWSSTDQV